MKKMKKKTVRESCVSTSQNKPLTCAFVSNRRHVSQRISVMCRAYSERNDSKLKFCSSREDFIFPRMATVHRMAEQLAHKRQVESRFSIFF